MFDIIAIGSATKDIFLGAEKLKRGKDFCFPLGKKIEIKNVRFFSGGGGVNAASTFARQGLKTALCGVIGQDLAGQEILDELNQKGIDVSLVKVKQKTATDLGLIFHAESERTILLSHSASRTLSEKDIDWSKLKETNWFYLAPLWGKAAKLTEKLLSLAKQRQVKIALNPSLDQFKLKDAPEILSRTDVLLLNDDEASQLTGVESYQEKKILKNLCARQRLAQKQIVVITNGKNGALAFDGKFVYQVPAPRVKVIDATGAGDSFGAGFVAGLIQANRGRLDLPRSRDIEGALRLAMANAIANIQIFGANQGLLRKNQPSLKIKARKTKWSV